MQWREKRGAFAADPVVAECKSYANLYSVLRWKLYSQAHNKLLWSEKWEERLGEWRRGIITSRYGYGNIPHYKCISTTRRIGPDDADNIRRPVQC